MERPLICCLEMAVRRSAPADTNLAVQSPILRILVATRNTGRSRPTRDSRGLCTDSYREQEIWHRRRCVEESIQGLRFWVKSCCKGSEREQAVRGHAARQRWCDVRPQLGAAIPAGPLYWIRQHQQRATPRMYIRLLVGLGQTS